MRTGRQPISRSLARDLAVLSVVTLGLVQRGTATPPSDAVPEYHVKAAFILNFIKFVEWPERALPQHEKNIVVGILNERPLLDAIDMFKRRTAKNRTVSFRVIKDAAAIPDCHVLFLNSNDETIVRHMLDEAGNRPILTVGETPGFLRWGGMINFTIAGDRVLFEISARNAGDRGLRLSAQLLEVGILRNPMSTAEVEEHRQ